MTKIKRKKLREIPNSKIKLSKGLFSSNNIKEINITGLNPDTIYVMALTYDNVPTEQEQQQLREVAEVFNKNGITLMTLIKPKQPEMELYEINQLKEALNKAEVLIRKN